MDYYEVYKKRLNHYGTTLQERLQGRREKDFENYLRKSVYRVNFEYKGKTHPATLERNSQDYTRTVQYLLTRIDLKIPSGTILSITDQYGDTHNWLIYWLEYIEASGYNRYTVVKMTHTLTWEAADGKTYSSLCFIHGKGDSSIWDAIKGTNAVYLENNNTHTAIMPLIDSLEKDTYMVAIVNKELDDGAAVRQPYKIEGFDRVSTPGVQFVTLDPVPFRDMTPPPSKQEGESEDDFYWLDFTGGSN